MRKFLPRNRVWSKVVDILAKRIALRAPGYAYAIDADRLQ